MFVMEMKAKFKERAVLIQGIEKRKKKCLFVNHSLVLSDLIRNGKSFVVDVIDSHLFLCH